MDVLTAEQRHKNMSRIKSKNTRIEIILRKALWHKGIRYRKNYNKLTGHPDIVLTKYRIAIFCDSEFWHGKDWNTKKKVQTNASFWNKKIENNIKRDKDVNLKLAEEGWIVLRFWGEDILRCTEECVNKILKKINDPNNN